MNVAVAEKPLTRAVITVAHIKPADGPRRSGSVKDSDGIWFGVWPDKLALLNVGEQYEVGFTENVKAGVTYRDIKTVKHITPYGHQPSKESSEDAAAAKVAQAVRQVPREVEPPRPRVAYNNNPGAAVMGMVNQYIGRGDVPLNADAIAQAIDICEAGYLKSKLAE